jgi:hypothetical protein
VTHIEPTTQRVVWLTALLVGAFAGIGRAQEAPIPEANPGRPTVSTPATLTPVGYLQFESGLLQAWNFGEFTNRFSFVNVTKIAFHRRLQFFVGFEPFVRFSHDDPAREAAGGTTAGTQYVIFDVGIERPTFAVSYAYSVFGGSAPDLDIGSAQHSVTLLGSDEVGPLHIDANLMFNRQTGDGVQPSTQFGQTLSIAHDFGSWVIAAELWHFTQPMLDGRTVGNLYCVSYALRPHIIFDFGFNRGLTSTSTPWQLLAGVTYLLPHRLWGSTR